MHVTHLSLTNFRNYGRLELDLPAGPILLHGANAQGKTNLLEAIYYLATGRSPHVEEEQQLINWEADRPEELVVVGRATAQVITSNGPRHVELRLIKEQRERQVAFRREALVDRRKVRLIDLLGNLRVVLFLPEDVQLVTGSPAGRRRYLDVTLCQSDAGYCRALADYNKVLEQRNALLRRMAEEGRGGDVLPIFTGQLVQWGSHVLARRAAFIHDLAREAQRIHYEELTNGQETVRLAYLPRLQANGLSRANQPDAQPFLHLAEWLEQHQTQVGPIAERFEKALAAARDAEIARATTLVGPHRDDWRFWVNGRELDHFGSRGQQRTAILALKLAEINWMTTTTQEAPVLLLDEVVAELDEQRRALLLQAVGRVSQAILTATDPAMIAADFRQQATMMQVVGGRIL